MKQYIVFTCFLAVAGCNSARNDLMNSLPNDGVPVQLTPKMTEQVKQGVASGLKDPESARFSPLMVAVRSGNTVHVCGYVNAKNSYGGYVGEKPFYATGIADLGSYSAISVGSDKFSNELTYEMCRKVGAPLEYNAANKIDR